MEWRIQVEIPLVSTGHWQSYSPPHELILTRAYFSFKPEQRHEMLADLWVEGRRNGEVGVKAFLIPSVKIQTESITIELVDDGTKMLMEEVKRDNNNPRWIFELYVNYRPSNLCHFKTYEFSLARSAVLDRIIKE
jgi:hypothetical protein